MAAEPAVTLEHLVVALSDALDFVYPYAAEHQQRVAYIALRMGRKLALPPDRLADLMYASALHDIGILSVAEKAESMRFEFEGWSSHVRRGAELLEHLDAFLPAAVLVRFHHHRWDDEEGWGGAGESVRSAANAIHLADHVDRMLRAQPAGADRARTVCRAVAGLSGTEFSPALVDCFLELSDRESFWLDLFSPRIAAVLPAIADRAATALPPAALEDVARIFSRVVDYRSAFTATHSAGVAAAAAEIARRMGFAEAERREIRIAGLLHDLGKICIPNDLLEKPVGLSPEEIRVMRGHAYYTHRILANAGGFGEVGTWAACHHERLDGDGYPFHLGGEDLPAGARIMCVADVFTALTELRPYRRGGGRDATVRCLRDMAAGGGLDADVVDVVRDGYEEIDCLRGAAQQVFAAEFADRFAPGVA